MNNAAHLDASSSRLHVVLGAGQIGPRVADLLLAQGHRVRLVQRTRRAQGAPSIERPGLTRVYGNITDLAFAEEATRGASVVYDCMNPPYHLWAEQLLPIARGALHGASKAGARLVALDCLYMYGAPDGPMREDSPRAPCSKKGALRVELEALRLSAQRRGDVRVAIGRASDFFGRDVPLSAWGERFYTRALAGKAVECMGDPDMPHAYTYVEDVARGLVTLGEREEAMGHIWHLPTEPAESTRALARRLGRALGLDVKVSRLPRFVLRVAGVFSPFMREVAEMAYQWDVPYVLDDARFRAAFGWSATPVERQVAEVAAWARRKYNIAAASGVPAYR
ncbi:NAD-dependent epimerase [Sorangium cellulosum]|uniref:NAD-dependent epimerase n=1 Tax=Sorangium cellulosum TaxID=56 RepID=A0A2L0EW20_SORCE|nr:NAD-dependent epimerase/dehydratase family protein [Sorangium cellulosum]AUX43497.1 NAD-dependent epimerase [Sorangium cellulosum]